MSIKALKCLSEARAILSTYPQTKELLEKVKLVNGIADLGFSLLSLPSTARWDCTHKTIGLNLDQIERGELDCHNLACFIIIECFNALKTQKFLKLADKAKKNLIDKKTFIETINQWEYRSATQCSALIKQGIKEGVFREDVRMQNFFSPFELHQKYHEVMGQSEIIEGLYNSLNPEGAKQKYVGTWNPPYFRQDKEVIERLFFLKAKIQLSTRRGHYRKLLQAELISLHREETPKTRRILAAATNIFGLNEFPVSVKEEVVLLLPPHQLDQVHLGPPIEEREAFLEEKAIDEDLIKG